MAYPDVAHSGDEFVAERASHTVPWDDETVLGVGAPLLEDLHGEATVEHAGGGEKDHGLFALDEVAVEGLDVLEVEDVLGEEGVLDLLGLPVDEELVEVVGLLDEACGEVEAVLVVAADPVGLEEDGELLRPAEGEDGDEDLAAVVESLLDLRG